MKRNLLFLITCLLAVGLIAAGCGDDDDDGGDGDSGSTTQAETTAATQPKADFIAAGNEICSEGNAELEASEGPADESPESMDAFVTDFLVPTIQKQIDSLRDLDPPDEGADEISSILDDAQAELDTLAEDPSSLGEDTFSDVNDRLNAFGLTECAG
jgi:hypothetical protein